MRNDVPAALPLLSFSIALGAAPYVTQPAMASFGLAAMALLFVAIDRLRMASAVAFLMAGLAIGHWNHAARLSEAASIRDLDGDRFVTVEAAIDGDWSARPHVFMLRVSRFHADGHEIQAPLRLYARFTPQVIEMQATVRAEGHLRSDRRGGYMMSIKSPRLVRYEGRLSSFDPASWNRRIANRLRAWAAERPIEIAMIDALLLGRGERLSDETKSDFKRGGTFHLLVFSGLQISLAAGIIAMLLRWAGASRAADWSLLAFSLVAPAFIGHEASVSRASTAIALYALSRIAARPTTFENLWCVAALARLLLVPSDLGEPAFHLTYAGAGALLFIGRPLAQSGLRWTAYAIAAEIAIAPLTLHHFHQYALGGSVMTILMTPIVFVMLIAGACFAATEAPFFLELIGALNGLCTVMNRAAAPLSGFFAAPALTMVVIAFAAAVAALAFLRGRARTATVIVALLAPPAVTVATFRARTEVADPQLLALDVGQGDAFVLRSGRRAILIDGGGRSGDARFGESVVLPVLLDRGIRSLDAAILTHAHPDHCGGITAVIRYLDVRELWISPRHFRGECARILLEAARDRAVPIRILRGGESLAVAGMTVRTLLSSRRYRRAPENNDSVIVSARMATRSLLFTGDIERDAERDLADRIEPVDILKVPHHGSRSSSSPVLLDAARPRIALISCGTGNFFGHPHPAVLEALQLRGVRIWRTDKNGTIEITLKQGIVEVRPEIDTPR